MSSDEPKGNFNDYVDYELIGGGPRDGHVGHMYTPAPNVLFKVPQADVYIAAANVPTHTELWHEYRLSRGTTNKLFYTYEGYTTNAEREGRQEP